MRYSREQGMGYSFGVARRSCLAREKHWRTKFKSGHVWRGTFSAMV
jgi:hypothetical protein